MRLSRTLWLVLIPTCPAIDFPQNFLQRAAFHIYAIPNSLEHAMFCKSTCCSFAFLFLLAGALYGQTDKPESEDAVPKEATSTIFGMEVESVRVFRRDASAASRNRTNGGTTIYQPRVETHYGKQYLVGDSASENHQFRYMYLLDDVIVMSFSNPNFTDKSAIEKVDPMMSKEDIKKRELVSEYYRLSRAQKTLGRKTSDLRQRIGQKEREIGRLKSGRQTEVAKTKLNVFGKEVELHQKELAKLEKEYESSELASIKKRLECVEAGAYQVGMD